MWALASHMRDPASEFEVVFCATDIASRSTRIDGMCVLGWTRLSLLLAIARSPVWFVRMVAKLVGLRKSYGLSPLRMALKTLHLRDAITRTNPDYLHLHGFNAAVFLQCGVFDPARTFVTIHGVFVDTGPRSYRCKEEALNRIPLKFLAFVTKKIMNDWRQTYGPSAAPTVVIPNAFDSDAFFLADGGALKGGDKKCYRLVSVGAICERKGQERVIDGMIRFKAAGMSHEVEFTMIGSGEPALVADLLQRAADAGIKVRHQPYVSPRELGGLLPQADYMILPSNNEGFGLVFLESIACGVPVVLPKDLPICEEPDLISNANAVFLESCSAEAIYAFLMDLPNYAFRSKDVAATLPGGSWNDIGARYRMQLSSRELAGPEKSAR